MAEKSPTYGELSSDSTQRALATILNQVPADAAAQIAHILATRANMYIDWHIFLGSDQVWEKDLGQPRSTVDSTGTGYIGIYGTMQGVEQSAEALKDLALFDPTQSSEDRDTQHFASLSAESDGLLDSSALYIHMTESGGGISQMEVRMAALNTLLTGKPLTLRVDLPERPENTSGDASKIWRSRMMIIADMIYLKATFGDKLPMYVSVSSNFAQQLPEDQEWLMQYIDDISENSTNAQKHVRNLDLTTPTPPDLFKDTTPSNEIVVSGSFNDELTRRNLLIKLGQSFPDMSISDTYVPNFSRTLPLSKLQENDLVSGLHTSSNTGAGESFHPPLVNVIQATQSYGDLSQATMSFLLSVIYGTYTILYLPKEANADRGSDLFTFQSHVRKLIQVFPTAARHIRIAETPDELTRYITTVKNHTPSFIN